MFRLFIHPRCHFHLRHFLLLPHHCPQTLPSAPWAPSSSASGWNRAPVVLHATVPSSYRTHQWKCSSAVLPMEHKRELTKFCKKNYLQFGWFSYGRTEQLAAGQFCTRNFKIDPRSKFKQLDARRLSTGFFQLCPKRILNYTVNIIFSLKNMKTLSLKSTKT